MGDRSAIEWTNASWNPVRGCALQSPGCKNCYAMRNAHRFSGPGKAYEGLTKLTSHGPVWTGAVRTVPEMLLLPLRWRAARRIFVDSMSDLFYERVPTSFIDQVFGVMALIAHGRDSDERHTMQILTKSPGRMRRYVLDPRTPVRVYKAAQWFAYPNVPLNLDTENERCGCGNAWRAGRFWPLANVWLGTSVENQRYAGSRRAPMESLARAGWLTWVSYEPALGAVDWRGWEFIRWLVSGGESGPRARPSHPDWHRAARDWCVANNIAYFFKQWGSHRLGEIDFSAGDVTIRWQDGREEWYGDHQDIKYSDHVLSQQGGRVVFAWPTGKKAAGNLLDGRTWQEYPR